MWSFIPKTLYDRYSKLMKLIMSIDSHFEVTENEEDSVRLHLPNYKGNQPMDFHIYMMEPLLFISFVTEVEGEKISVLNSYPQDMNQQDMFNAAMASNLEKIHETIENTIKVENKEEEGLNDEQRYALYYYADLCYNSCTKKSDAKQSTLFNLFLSRLNLSEEDILQLKSYHSSAKPEELYRALRSIDDKELFEIFISMCVVFVDDADTYFTEKEFGDMLQAIGLTIYDVRAIMERKGLASIKHYYDRERTTAWDDVNEEVDASETWIDEYGAEYSTDRKRLIHVPGEIRDYSILEGTEEIEDYAFANFDGEDIGYSEIIQSGRNIEDCIHSTSELVSVTIPSSVNRIGKGIFDWCNKLVVISIPQGTKEKFVTMLPDYEDILIEGDISTTAHVEDLENAWIDESGVKYSLDKRKLLKAPNDITKYAILPGTKIICDGAFFECANLVSLHLPESIIIIGNYSFYGCEHLSEANLPKAIKRIGDHAFDECYALSSLYVSKTGYTQFARMIPTHYQKIKESPLNSVMDEHGVVYDNDYQILHFNTLPLDAYTVESGVKVIDHYAFEPTEWKKDNGKSLKRLYLPDSITMIGDAAFANNQALEYINIPKNASFLIDDNPFAGCTNLHTIKWETEKAVKEGTLIYNQEQTALIACLPWHYIGGIVNSWTLLDFARQHGKMQVGEFKNKDTGELFKSCIFTKPDDGARTFVAFSSAMGELTPKEIAAQKNELTVVQLESGNYSLCKGRVVFEQDRRVDMPYGVKTIAAHAFSHNEVLQEITLPATIEAIGKNVFEGCSSLRAIYIPKELHAKFEKMLVEWKHLVVEQKDLLPF